MIDGETPVAKLGLAELSMSIDAIASTHAALETAEAALRATVQQETYEIHYALDGTDHGDACTFRKTCRRL